MFRAHVFIIRWSKLYYTASGIITPVGGRPVRMLREVSYWRIFRKSVEKIQVSLTSDKNNRFNT